MGSYVQRLSAPCPEAVSALCPVTVSAHSPGPALLRSVTVHQHLHKGSSRVSPWGLTFSSQPSSLGPLEMDFKTCRWWSLLVDHEYFPLQCSVCNVVPGNNPAVWRRDGGLALWDAGEGKMGPGRTCPCGTGLHRDSTRLPSSFAPHPSPTTFPSQNVWPPKPRDQKGGRGRWCWW